MTGWCECKDCGHVGDGQEFVYFNSNYKTHLDKEDRVNVEYIKRYILACPLCGSTDCIIQPEEMKKCL